MSPFKHCEPYEALIEEQLAGTLGEEGSRKLELHAAECAVCRQLLDVHERLLEPGESPRLPGDAEFAAMRAAVLRRIRGRQRPSLGRALGDLWLALAPLRPAFGAAVLVVLAAAGGWYAGTSWGIPRGATVLSLPELLVEEARANQGVLDAEGSPYLYSNVSFDDAAGSEMELSFDVTRHVRLRRPRQDPLVKELLVQSLLQPEPLGTRLQAVRFAGEMIDPKVRQALIATLFDDPDQIVRQRALEALAPHRDDEEVQAALLRVLRSEESVGLRLSALDVLADSALPSERLAGAMDGFDRPEDQALLVRAARRMGDAR